MQNLYLVIKKSQQERPRTPLNLPLARDRL